VEDSGWRGRGGLKARVIMVIFREALHGYGRSQGGAI